MRRIGFLNKVARGRRAHSDIVLRGAEVLTLNPNDPTGDVPYRADIEIENGRINRIVRAPSVPIGRIDKGEKCAIDASGCLVLPGFVDGHHRLGPSLARRMMAARARSGSPMVAATETPSALCASAHPHLRDEDRQALIAADMRDLFLAGVTSVCYTNRDLHVVARAAIETGMRTLVASEGYIKASDVMSCGVCGMCDAVLAIRRVETILAARKAYGGYTHLSFDLATGPRQVDSECHREWLGIFGNEKEINVHAWIDEEPSLSDRCDDDDLERHVPADALCSTVTGTGHGLKATSLADCSIVAHTNPMRFRSISPILGAHHFALPTDRALMLAATRDGSMVPAFVRDPSSAAVPVGLGLGGSPLERPDMLSAMRNVRAFALDYFRDRDANGSSSVDQSRPSDSPIHPHVVKPTLVEPIDVIKMATVDCAKALRMRDPTVGTLQEGGVADLVVLPMFGDEKGPPFSDPLAVVLGENLTKPSWVIAGGRVVVREGHLVDSNDVAIKRDHNATATATIKDLLARI